ncbi:tumor necrosis factor receptor superfamily member 9-like [Enoplosus armatus]|uniref:tumor necrosis factor receptor superfamily member 9-like n=1 Tax=Enoplosus armatus TaxID=215367 RepID=UPI0039910CC6
MAMILWAMGLSLLMQDCLCSIGQTDTGCMKWIQNGENVCCEACHPGNRLVKECGPKPRDLCTPCESRKFTVNPKDYRCYSCTQCVGAQVLVKECTAAADTKCGCKEGLTCGDDRCSFCVQTCGKGQEPAEKRSCRPCPGGTFNDQIHQMCKPWSTKCPNPEQKIVAKGDRFTDIKCANISLSTVILPKKPDHTDQAWSLVAIIFVITFIIITIAIIVVAVKILWKRKEEKETKKPQIRKTQIIRTPTDDPTTLIAVECSFHEAQQEQGSSSESLASKDSSNQLLA